MRWWMASHFFQKHADALSSTLMIFFYVLYLWLKSKRGALFATPLIHLTITFSYRNPNQKGWRYLTPLKYFFTYIWINNFFITKIFILEITILFLKRLLLMIFMIIHLLRPVYIKFYMALLLNLTNTNLH